MRLKKLVTILTLLVIVLAATFFALSETWWDQVEVDGELYRASGSVNNSRGTFADTSTAYVQAETPSHLRVEVAHSHEGGTSWNEDFTIMTRVFLYQKRFGGIGEFPVMDGTTLQ